jgi:hypothetical protein
MLMVGVGDFEEDPERNNVRNELVVSVCYG